MTNKERKEKGMVYRYDDPELMEKQHIYQNKMAEYNHTLPIETEKGRNSSPRYLRKSEKGVP